MGHEDDRLLLRLPQPHQVFLHQLAGLGVEGTERLVHEEDVGVGGERPRQSHPLLHAARQLVGVVVGEAGQPDPLEERPGRLPALLAAHASHLEPEADVGEDVGPGQQDEVLEHHRPVVAGAGDRVPVDDDPAGVGPDQAGRHLEEGGLPAATGADDREELLVLDREGDVFERLEDATVAGVECAADALYLDHLVPSSSVFHLDTLRSTRRASTWRTMPKMIRTRTTAYNSPLWKRPR